MKEYGFDTTIVASSDISYDTDQAELRMAK